jgi:hypothetical protein
MHFFAWRRHRIGCLNLGKTTRNKKGPRRLGQQAAPPQEIHAVGQGSRVPAWPHRK